MFPPVASLSPQRREHLDLGNFITSPCSASSNECFFFSPAITFANMLVAICMQKSTRNFVLNKVFDYSGTYTESVPLPQQ